MLNYEPLDPSKFSKGGDCDEGGYLHTHFGSEAEIYNNGFMLPDAVDCIGVVANDLRDVIIGQMYFNQVENKVNAELFATAILSAAKSLQNLLKEDSENRVYSGD